MAALQSIDIAVFRFINGTLSNAFFDWLMPILAGGDWFLPLVLLLAGFWIWKGGSRARLCALMLAIVIPIGDGWITNTIKKAVARPRPCRMVGDVRLPMKQAQPRAGEENEFRRSGCTSTGSMPSGHTTNWFAATMVVWIFYRRAWRVMLPMAAAVGFSRIYNGVHYPADVLAGAIIGSGYGLALSIGVNAFWRRAVVPFFPRWCGPLPSLLPSSEQAPELEGAMPAAEIHWLRLGLLLIGGVLIARLWHAGSDRTDLSADEAFRWLWSTQLNFGNWFHAPLGIWLQWLGQKVFGPHEFAVRFLPPIYLAVASLAAQRFFMREVSARAGFWLVVILQLTPLLTAGSSLAGADALLVLFCTLSMFAGWRALGPQGTLRDWGLLGLWMGLAYFTNVAGIILPFSWVTFFSIWKLANIHQHGSGPARMELVLISFVTFGGWFLSDWNTVVGQATGFNLGPSWRTRFDTPWEFLGLSAALVNPILLAGMVWAAVAFWKDEKHNLLPRLFFVLGAPLLLGCTLFFLPAQLRLNWIAISVIPLSCLLVVFWRRQFDRSPRLVSLGLATGLVWGLASTALLHESSLTKTFTGSRLPPQFDPLQRVRGWTAMGRAVSFERNKLMSNGPPVFVIGDNLGTASLLTFYLPRARTNTATPIVYCREPALSDGPDVTWPAYSKARTGQNAIYVQDSMQPALAPPELARQFASVTNLGTILIHHRGRPLRHMRLFECRNLLP